MKFQTAVRTQLVVAVFGATLLLAGGAKAQEIVNTEFADGPNVVAMRQTSTATVAQTEVQATSAAEQEDQGEQQSDRLLWAGTALIWIGAIGIYFCGPARRFAREMQSLGKLYVRQGVAGTSETDRS